MARRTALIVLALLAATTLAAGSMSYTSVQADRNVEIAVVEDSAAYLGLADPTAECEGDDCDSAAVLEVTNGFTTPMTIQSIDATADGTPVTVVGPDDYHLDIGGSRTIRVDAGADTDLCDDSAGDTETTLSVTISASTTTAEVTRYDKQVTVSCESTDDATETSSPTETDSLAASDVTFNGCGNVQHPESVSVKTYVYYQPSEGTYDTRNNKQDGGQLVGIVTSDGEAFAKESFSFNNPHSSGNGNGDGNGNGNNGGNCGTSSGESVEEDSPPWGN